MKCLKLLAVLCLALTLAPSALGAKGELQLPSIKIGADTYSNAVLTLGAKQRISVEHSRGMASLKIAELSPELARQLLQAGVVAEYDLNANPRYLADEKERQRAEKARLRGESPEGPVTKFAGMEGSMASKLGGELEKKANAHGGLDPRQLLAAFSMGLLVAMAAGALFFYCLRCWCLHRICKKSTGRGSFLILLPMLRWFALLPAARMSRHWLWFPSFGIVLAAVNPPLPPEPWAQTAYQALMGACALATVFMFVIWCFKICTSIGRSPGLGILLLMPLLEWVSLLALALGSGEPKAKPAESGRMAVGRPVMAI